MRPISRQAPEAAIMTMGEVAERVGAELTLLTRSVQHLQGLISPLILEAAARNPSHLHELQDFDHIAQKLGNLGDFLTALASHVPGHWRVDPTLATQVVTLSDLSSRLGLMDQGEAAGDHSAGDFELF